MERLLDSQKELLRTLVKLHREGAIGDAFSIYWSTRGANLSGKGRSYDLADLTPLSIELLGEEGLIFQRSTDHSNFTATRWCSITPAGFRAVDSNFSPTPDVQISKTPVEITESLARFRHDFPDHNKLAFVMMQFGRTDAHSKILSGIRDALEPHGMVALRADDKEYHEDLYHNILTYIYGVRFGIAVFERIEQDDFNPNVSLEVGYMLGLRKSICLLKDKTLSTLNTDLVGKLYRTFDPQNPGLTIPQALFDWMEQKGFILRST